ncbi:MAG: hypothetical protein DHS20C16_15510 [Phycisphaerae bacterium]|nr:MAG: hypothetical protein DHS20C16_15510 [Phycisphaerae bacterium]
MVGIGNGCFLMFPGESSSRILHPGEVRGFSDDVFTLEMKVSDLSIDSDRDALVYFEKNRDFMQQPARIEAVELLEADEASDENEGPKLLVEISVHGEPVSAESRQHYRVSTVIVGYEADVNEEVSCKVLDVSGTGLAVIASESYEIGNVLDVSIVEDGKTYSGRAGVQSVRELAKKQTRYGLYCVDETKGPDSLVAGLKRANMRLQREQLRRLAGNA